MMFYRRQLRRLALLGLVTLTLIAVIGLITAHHYPAVSTQARVDELAFWEKAKNLSLEERSAIYNYTLRTHTAPRLLPPWEYDKDMCAAVVVKTINLFTGVEFVHTKAWTFRTFRLNENTVSNARKLTTVWNETAQYDANGDISSEMRATLVAEVLAYPFDPQKVYVLGALWTETQHWQEIVNADADINSHLVFIARGMAIHFIHREEGADPLHFEPLADVFADGTMKPIWVAEVHEKSRARKGKGDLEWDPLRLPVVSTELAFTQNVIPYDLLLRMTAFPSKPSFAPQSLWPWFAQADSGVEKTLLYQFRGYYDFYPRIKEIDNDKASH